MNDLVPLAIQVISLHTVCCGLQEISQVESDAFMASLKKTLFESTVPKAEYTEMKQVGGPSL